MTQSLFRFGLILTLMLPACNAREGDVPPSQSDTTAAEPASPPSDPVTEHRPAAPQRPATRRDSIQLEGSYHPITARLVEAQGSLPFSTYMPGDMQFEQISSGEGEGYYFYAHFGGQRNQNAFMLVHVLPAGSTQADAQARADALLRSRSGSGRIANVRVGSHNNHFFYLAQAYPAEFGDGLGPRTHYIRTHWVWHDGTSLDATLGPRRE